MSTSARERQPAGVPIGGQFAATARAEAAVDLGEDPSPRDAHQDARLAVEHFSWRGQHDDVVSYGSDLAAIARDLGPHLSDQRRSHLDDARAAFTSASPDRAYGPAHALHSELVDALSDAPTRHEVEALEGALADAGTALRDACVDRDLGLGDEAAVASARSEKNRAEQAAADAVARRRAARIARLRLGTPTTRDCQDAEECKRLAHLARRAAVNAADAARDVYVTTEADHPEFDRRRLHADEMTRREHEAQTAYDRAQRELDGFNHALREASDRHASAASDHRDATDAVCTSCLSSDLAVRLRPVNHDAIACEDAWHG